MVKQVVVALIVGGVLIKARKEHKRIKSEQRSPPLLGVEEVPFG